MNYGGTDEQRTRKAESACDSEDRHTRVTETLGTSEQTPVFA